MVSFMKKIRKEVYPEVGYTSFLGGMSLARVIIW